MENELKAFTNIFSALGLSAEYRVPILYFTIAPNHNLELLSLYSWYYWALIPDIHGKKLGVIPAMGAEWVRVCVKFK